MLPVRHTVAIFGESKETPGGDLASELMLRDLPDDVDAFAQGQAKQANAGDALHAQQGPWA